ncbi:MAG: hypothetical protein WC479_07975 [Candidatus Izemoplasmatales bacterium]|nr:hypothetical protein [Candidatus Izemoplasmatales bacterium]MDD3865523.1 hypothetical protein [Candidatus Izemoplasmatales bacterium]
MPNFTWASKKTLDDVATLYGSNITLNKSASSYFEDAYIVLVGLNAETMQIAIKPMKKEDAINSYIPEDQWHNITVKSSYSRICNKAFMKEVADLMNLSFENNNSYKFKAAWSQKEDALIIDLKNEEE